MTQKNEKLTQHFIPDLAQQGQQPIIEVADNPGTDGCHHRYRVYQSNENPFFVVGDINFQNGPVKNGQFNGVTEEVILAVLIHRYESHQDGPFKCSFNHVVLEHLKQAMSVAHKRTKDRLLRAVEGDFKP